MQQRSLFPDGFEVQEEALSALRELRIERALGHLRRARLGGTPLVGIDALEQALQWLAPRIAGTPDVAAAARALCDLPAAVAAGLDATAVGLIEAGLAGFLAPRLPRAGFVDAGRVVPVSRVLLLRGDAAAARDAAAELLGAGHGDHAGAWFDHADACWLLQRHDEANASYVRALLLGPHAGHAYRCRHEALRTLWQRLQGTSDGGTGLLLAEAWSAGVLSIPPGNTWLTAAHRECVRERSAGEPDWRFSWLVYVDRSARAGECNVELREQMAALLPEAFARFVTALSRRQG